MPQAKYAAALAVLTIWYRLSWTSMGLATLFGGLAVKARDRPRSHHPLPSPPPPFPSPFVAGSPASLAAAGRRPALPHRRPSLAAQLHLSSEENVAFSQTVASVVAGAQRKARRMTMTAQSLGLFSPSKERSE